MEVKHIGYESAMIVWAAYALIGAFIGIVLITVAAQSPAVQLALTKVGLTTFTLDIASILYAVVGGAIAGLLFALIYNFILVHAVKLEVG
jgi:hypothetical protein